MSANPQKVTVSKDELPTTTNDPAPGCDSAESAALNGDQSNRSTHCQDSNIKTSSKKVKIVDPKQTNEVESDEEDSLSQPGAFDRANSVAAPSTSGQPSDPQATAATVTDRKKTREERKKEREKKKEEEMLKKYQAEQEAKQKVSAKSKCGRWIKHNLKIGEGGYKFVYRGYDATEAKNVAWCEFKREHVDTKEKRQAMFKETEIMLKMNHPHIVRCFDVFREWIDMEDPNNQIEEKGVVIIQELMGEGTLKSVIRKNFLEGQCILKFPLITRWWHQILDALRYMHHKIQPPILHRDLKADNCFLYGASDEEYLNVKVGDFGLATHVNNSGRKTMLGTLGFMAPEIFDEKYDEKVDIYAFGMLMLEVMTNRTPYDECETVLQVAAKTMSGQGPDIMEKVLNPSLREVISACIQPLTCFRPTAEELYFHPLFQRYQEGDDSWPKTLPVEVEPNYDNATDRAEVLDRFVRSLDNTETLNPNFNLRLRFRDKKMLQELGLDDGESLEFDLDIYKAEDQDIPDLIHNLRLGYEDKLSRVFENPKQPDKKIVSNHLDKLFNSIRLQMQFLVKVLLGKRWKAILDSMVSEPRAKKRQEGSSTVDEDEESDADARDASSFAIIGKYKSKWTRAKKLLEKEIQAYRNATATTPSLSTAAGTSGTTTVTTTTVSGSTVIGATIPVTTSSTLLPVPSSADSNATIGASTVAASVPGHSSHPSGSHTDPGDSVMAAINSTAGVNVTTVGKFSITTPASAVVAPVSPVLVTNGVTPVPTPLPTPVPPDTVPGQKPQQLQQPQPVAQHVGMSSQSIPMSDPVHHTQIAQQQQLDSDLAINRVPPDSGVAQMVPSHPSGPHIPTQAPIHPTLTAPYAPNPSSNLPGMFKVGPDASATADSTARWNTFQQALQRLASGSLKGFGKMVDLGPTQLMQSSLTPGTQFSPNQQLTLQQLQLLFAVASALAPEQTQQSVAPGQQSMPTQSTGISGASAPSASQETLLQSQAINAGILQSTGMDGVSNQQPFVPNQPPVGMYPQAVAASLNQALFAAMSKPHATPSADPQTFIAPNLTVQSSAGAGAPSTDSEVPGSIDPVLLNQLTEALMSIQASASGSSQYAGFPFGPGYAMGLTQQTAQAAQPGVTPITGHHGNLTGTSQPASVVQQQQQPQQILAQSTAALSPKQGDRKVKKKAKSKPRYILRVTKLERDTDSNEPGALRPTFYLEMPDLNNPNSELWKLSFRCNLSDTPDDIKLFQGSGYTPANEEIDRAAKEAVVQMLESLRTDVNSIKVNQDYVFYPRSSAQLGAPGLLPVADNLGASSTAVTPATLPISVGATTSTLLSTRSSQSSSNLPSVVSHSITNQAAPTPATSVSVIKPIPGIIPNSSSSVFFDGNPAVTNLEEVPPIDRIGQVTSGVPQVAQVDESGMLRGPPSSGVMDGGLGSMDTARDDEDEFSETSRPLSPIDGPSQTLPSQSLQHLFASGMELDSGCKNALGSQQSSYLSTTSYPGVRPGNEGVHGVTGENADPALTKRPFIPFGIANVNDLLSLASKHVDSSGPTANGFQIGLEEVPPLAPGAALTDPTVPGYLQPSDSVVQTEFGPYDAAVGTRVDNASHPSYEANSGLVSQLSQVSSVSQGRICPSQPYCTSTPDSDSMINLTCTIPACLEALLRDITCRLCSAPSRPYILLPSTDGTYHDGTYQANSMRILEVPNGHIFLGIPELKSPTQSCGSYSLTTFRAPVEPTFVVLNGMNPDSRVTGPHVYKTPPDCAVVLSPNGQVHRLEKAALVVPVAPSDVPRTTTPPSSPGFDTGMSHGLQNSSVQVRELPIQTNLDTLTFDDVLNLLLALRSTSQPTVPHRSTTASPTIDSHLASHPMAHVSAENQPLSTSTSRRSSALPGLHGVNSAHSLHGLLPAQLLQPHPHTVTSFNQLQSQSAGMTLRGTPQLQGSQAAPVNAVTFHPDAHFQSSQITATHVPFQMQAPVSATSDASSGIIGSAFTAHTHGLPSDTGFNTQTGSYGPFNPIHASSMPPSTLHLPPQPPTHAPLKTIVDRAPGSSQPTSNVPVNLHQSLLQQLLQSQAAPPASSQSQVDSLYTAGQNVQQVLQLLSVLTATNPDQMPSVLNQLRAARIPTGPHSVPLNSTPLAGGGGSNMGSTVQSRQASPPLPTGLKQGSCAAGTAPAVQPAALRANTVSPTAPPASNGPGVSSLPALLSRLLSSGAANVDWGGAATLEPIRTSASQPATTTQAAARPSLIPSVQPVATGSGTLLGHDPTSLVHPTSLNSTASGSGTLQQPLQLAQHPGMQQKRGSQPSESQSFGLSAGAVTQPQHHVQIPELNNLLCSLQKNSEAVAALPIEVQNFLLGALQQQQKLQQPQQSHIPLSALQSGWMGTTTTHPAVPSSTVPSQSLGPKQTAPGSRVFPTVVPGSVVPAPAITSIDAMAPQPSVVKEPVKVNAFDPITSQTVPIISTGDSVHRTAPTNPTTVANKFTVVPVSSENEEPASPSQVVNATGGVVPWTTGPPRPPRRLTHPSGPPAPPVTPNSQLSTDSACIGPMVTTSSPGTSVMMVTSSSANIASSGVPVLPVTLPSVTSVPVNSAQPKLVHSKFKVEPVTVTPSSSSTPGVTTGTVTTAPGIRNQRVTQAAGNSALPVPTGSTTVSTPYVASTANNNINNQQVSSNGSS